MADIRELLSTARTEKNPKKSLDILQKALYLAEKSNDPFLAASCLLEMTSLYKVLGFHEKELESLSRVEKIGELLLEEIAARFDNEPLDISDLEFSESFAEILDRFIVLHIRMWKLEDAAGASKSDSELASLKRKIDYCFKDRRPKLIKAINSFLDIYINKRHIKRFSEENIKFYKGFSND